MPQAAGKRKGKIKALLCIGLLLGLAACQGRTYDDTQVQMESQKPMPGAITMHVPSQHNTPTPGITATQKASSNPAATQPSSNGNGRPVLAFYYP